MRKLFTFIALLAVMLLASVPAMAQQSNTIVDVAASNPDFSTLVTAVQAAGLVDTLSGPGPFTVFAPTNEAFAALGQDTINAVLADKKLLTSILTYHVVAGKVMAADVVNLTSAKTVEGADIKISVKDGKVYLNDTIQVVTTDIQASNGVIHVIDGVLMPPTEEATMPAAQEMTHIRVAHFSPDTPAVDVYLNGELSAVQGLAFPDMTEWIEVPAGTYNVAVAPAGTSIESAAIGPADFDLPAGAWITIAAVGSLSNNTLKPVVLVEDYKPTDGNARVTVFHAIEDAPAVDVLAGNSKVITGLAYPGKLDSNDGLYSLDVPAGTYDFKVVPSGQMTPVVLDLPGTALSADMNYFVAAVGTLANPQVVVKASAVPQEMMSAAPTGTIVDIAASNPDFSTLVTAVQAAGLVDTLNGPGPFTVFAPTNEAFAALGQDTINSVLADKKLLTNILTYHVVAGDVMAADVVNLTSAKTVEGADIKISVKDGKVYLNDTIQVVTTDIQASNGIIHVIDGVLLPPA